jgi:hypothetical protein
MSVHAPTCSAHGMQMAALWLDDTRSTCGTFCMYNLLWLCSCTGKALANDAHTVDTVVYKKVIKLHKGNKKIN